ncbi:MAG: phage antirepressor KilAC domain-containing protein [Atopobiaceae bacterium]|nr:phage antirepressor KilAC domain-containing protein [Atopobiaceae bacterium]
MDKSIRVFQNDQFGQVRAVRSESGEPWFVAKDVCDALGIRTDTVRAILDADEVRETNPNTVGVAGGRKPLVVSEAGLYSLILRSRKPEAKAFKRWVTHEVLPALRRDGGYMVARDETPEQTMARAVLLAQQTIDRQKGRIAELEPKALFADAVAASDGTCLVGELAKMMRQNGVEVGQNRLFAMLREDGYLGNVGQNRNVPTQRAMDLGLFRIKETAVTHSDGHVTLSRTPKVTGKGQRYFVKRYCGGLQQVLAQG